MSKKILGLDLGTTSIGWAYVTEAESPEERSTIERLGVRVNPLTTDEQTDFEKGKPTSVNAERTLKRGARRNLQRYKLRRSNLIDALLKNHIITAETSLAEDGKNTTHATYALRAKAATEKVTKEEFARVLLMINKKRGYKSSRKAKNEEEGQIIDGMEIARVLYEEQVTPGQLCYRRLQEGKKTLPDFYRSDLNAELEKVWAFQKQFHTDILTPEFRKEIEGKGQRATAAIFWAKYGFNTAQIKGTREEKKMAAYEWRSKAINTQLDREQLAYVITEINSNINNSSGYLGAISDRSKELFFNRQTVGQYLYAQLAVNPPTRLKNQVFYRQDYLDEFEKVWETQAQFHDILIPSLKEEIRDVIIFYQRKLKSQKGLVSFCEFESKSVDIEKDGKKIKKTIGYKVIPKSSPLFQEFKIWQNLGSLKAQNKETKEVLELSTDAKRLLFDELNVKGNLSKEKVLSLLGYKSKDWELNFTTIEGNRTNRSLYDAYLKILEAEGYDVKELLKIKGDKDDVELKDIVMSSKELKLLVGSIFNTLGIGVSILEFNAELDGKAFEQQASYRLWHLLYSYEEDKSPSGNEELYRLLTSQFGFALPHAKILANVPLSDDYGSLSAKAIRKIYPFLKENIYSEACRLAGYNHSSFLTKEENDNRPLEERLELLPKNSLRNPVAEKILNQMVNVVNAIIDDPSLGKPDEIRIELARELKKNAEERREMTASINKANAEHERIRQILIKEDDIKNPTRNDIIRYKLYQELKNNGYKTLYSDTYIPREKLYSKEFDIEHIIPKALLFDDSFSNKTLCVRKENLDKGDRCAGDFIGAYFGEDKVEGYLARAKMLYEYSLKSPGEGISKAKYRKLLMKAGEIGKGFIERDLRDTQYISRKARLLLLQICRKVVATTGSVTDRLRDDWGLVNVMQELNIEKYRKLGLTEMIEKKDGSKKERIIEWTKRNDHRHHAMDALTIAFTKHSHIQYLNNLNARKQDDQKGNEILGIESKLTRVMPGEGRKFIAPMLNFREEAKRHLENILVSYKAKNKVATKNKNKYKTAKGELTKIELTPRGQLHKETVYGKMKVCILKELPVNGKFEKEMIERVVSQTYKGALLARLKANSDDPKKAFAGKNSLEKSPLYLDESKTFRLPERVKVMSYEDIYTIRKDVNADNFKDAKSIEKVMDAKVREILLQRLILFRNNAKEAFSNLDKNPIWFNENKGIAIKRVTISGIANALALHDKKDHTGRLVHDSNGNATPVDFVSTGNNHHVAIYVDAEDGLQEQVVSFYEAITRMNENIPIIDKNYNSHLGWKFLFTMKQNEFFVFPSSEFDLANIDLRDPENYKMISSSIFRVQKIASKNYFFRHHLETTVEERKPLINVTYKPQLGLNGIKGIVKIRINHLGKIVRVGEY